MARPQATWKRVACGDEKGREPEPSWTGCHPRVPIVFLVKGSKPGGTCKGMAGLFPLMDLLSFPVSFDAQPGGEVLFSVWSVRPKLTVAKESWLSVRIRTLWVITVIRTD